MRLFFLILVLLPVAVRAQPSEPLELTPVSYEELPGWGEWTPVDGSVEAFIRSCERFTFLGLEYDLGEPAGMVAHWLPACIALGRAYDADYPTVAAREAKLRTTIESYLVPYKVQLPEGKKSLFTGYYEIELQGSLTQDEAHPYPIYTLPEKTSLRTKSRAEIDAGALDGQGLELVYVSDPVRLFFLHVQGSGQVVLPDGRIMRVGYAGQNGHDYQSIGKYLVEQGAFTLEEVTAPLLMEYLYDRPAERDVILQQNASYIFFREVTDETRGPIGSMEVPLVAGYSMAVDKRLIPLGVPLWLSTTISAPKGETAVWQRLMVAHDTGGAIKGAVRGDIFFGAGDLAEWRAGHQRAEGEWYLLLPKKNLTPGLSASLDGAEG